MSAHSAEASSASGPRCSATEYTPRSSGGCSSSLPSAKQICHHLRKDGIDELEHGAAAAEIAVQGERTALPREPRKLLGKEGGAAAAEPVNGLLYVADHEHVFAGDEGEDALLRGVNILILVDENVGISARHLRAHLRLCETAEAVVLEVVEIERAGAALEGGKLLVIDEQKLRDALGDLAGRIKSGTLLLFRAEAGELLFQSVNHLLEGGEFRIEGEGGGIP